MSAFPQYPKHNAIHTKLFGSLDIVAHDFKFMIGVTKIASPWADQNVNGNRDVSSSRSHKSRAGSDSPGRQVTAEFNAVCATTFRRDRKVHRFNADFQDSTIGHDLRARRTKRRCW
jgi:hypothetical protein